MVGNNGYINNINRNIGRISGNQTAAERQKTVQSGSSFEKVLQDTLTRNSEVKFSRHAEQRLVNRNIKLSQAQMGRINEAVKKAEEKGVKDSLVLMDSVALVVNIKSRTVITAMDNSELKENVFTNIDGAVIT
jgi:flagellar operon protein